MAYEDVLKKLRIGVGQPGGYSTMEEWRKARESLKQAAKSGDTAARSVLGASISPTGTVTTRTSRTTETSRPAGTIDTSPLYKAIGSQPTQIKTPKPTTPQTFTLDQILEAIRQAGQAGGQVPAPAEARFQTPEQLGQYIGQFQQMFQPWVESQKRTAEEEANKALRSLQSQWASRGLLASGGAQAQEREAATALAGTKADIEAQALANAISQALQYGQLGLQEAGQLWDQMMQGKTFEYGRARDTVRDLLAALGQQEQMRQFEQGLGLDVERLNAAERQAFIDNLSRALGMDISQEQWAREFLEGIRQFEKTFPLTEAGVTGTYQGQPTWQRVLQEAALTGTYQGQPTFERLLQEAALTGMYQGQPTWQRVLDTAALTGMFQGSPTWERTLAERKAEAAKKTPSVDSKAIQEFQTWKDQGIPYDQAMSMILGQAPELEAGGADVEKLIEALNLVYHGRLTTSTPASDKSIAEIAEELLGGKSSGEEANKKTMTDEDWDKFWKEALGEENYKKLLKSRSWWTKFLDAIKPGPQGRTPKDLGISG